ncbi:MAG TPA: DUF1269 domain-containing protein [Candidatus Limnocylindrales bacterium]|nr:DUF1269 domain-containing protein [Candidatus Limnocylindrales bacterium]
MSQIVVVSFDSEEDAQQALRSLRSLEHAGAISFEDTAIVAHRADGKVEVKNEASSATETGAVVGAVLGGLLFVVFPVVGMAVGAAAGAGIGASLRTGVDGKFVDEVKSKLPPGKSALFLVIKDANADATIPALRKFHGEVIQTSLDDDVEQALRDALK